MAPPTSLTDRVVTRTLGGHVLAAGFFGTDAVFATADGKVHIGAGMAAMAHDAGMLTAVIEKASVLTAGEDGGVARTGADGNVSTLSDGKGQWIDALASGPDGAAAWSQGKRVTARSGKGEIKTTDFPSTARGLAFMPKGYRLVASHYNGASLWFPNASAAPELLVWKGSHLDVMRCMDGGSTTRRICG
jgi:hypothetical protein